MTEDGLRTRVAALLGAWREGRVARVEMGRLVTAACEAAHPEAVRRVIAGHPSPAVRLLLRGRCL